MAYHDGGIVFCDLKFVNGFSIESCNRRRIKVIDLLFIDILSGWFCVGGKDVIVLVEYLK